jgi:hypothetical protein
VLYGICDINYLTIDRKMTSKLYINLKKNINAQFTKSGLSENYQNIIINQLKYITFLVYNTKISDNNAESGKVPRMLAAFPRCIEREILSKRNFFDFELPDDMSPMTLMKSMASLHQGPKVSKAKPLNM